MPAPLQFMALIIIFILFYDNLTTQFTTKYRKEKTDEQIENSLAILLITGWWLTSVIVSCIVNWTYKIPSG